MYLYHFTLHDAIYYDGLVEMTRMEGRVIEAFQKFFFKLKAQVNRGLVLFREKIGKKV